MRNLDDYKYQNKDYDRTGEICSRGYEYVGCIEDE